MFVIVLVRKLCYHLLLSTLDGLLKLRKEKRSDALTERKKCNINKQINKPTRPLQRHVKFDVTSTLARLPLAPMLSLKLKLERIELNIKKTN